MIGKTLAHYRILKEIGRGGMGIVYRAEDTKLDRTVALKVLPMSALSSAADRARFYREAKAAAGLHHPHIASVFEIDEAVPVDETGSQASGSEERRPFIAMEFIDGQTLEDRIDRGPLPLPDAVRIAAQIARALEAAHKRDIVHRDIKSANIMLAADGEAKVLDFGLAQTTASTKLTRMDSTLGTVAYMSPEQARGDEVDARTDLWALGVVLYEMISGTHPFGGDYEQAVVYSILNVDPEPLTGLRTGVPLELEAVVRKLLRKDAGHRYQTAADLLADLDLIREMLRHRGSGSGLSTSAVGVASGMPGTEGVARSVPAAWSARRVAAVVGVGLLCLLAGVLLGRMLQPETRAPVRTFLQRTDSLQWVDLVPDGLSYVWVSRDTLWHRPLDRVAASPVGMIPEMEYDAGAVSPDGDRVALLDGTRLRTYSLTDAGTIDVADLPPFENINGLVWAPNGLIYVALTYGGADSELFSVPSTGGRFTPIDRQVATQGGHVLESIAWMPGRNALVAGIAVPGGENRLAIPDPFLEGNEDLDARLAELTTGTDRISTISVDPFAGILFERRANIWLLELDSPSALPEKEPRVLFPNVGLVGTTTGRLLMGLQILDDRGRLIGEFGPVPGLDVDRTGLLVIDPETGAPRLASERASIGLYPSIDPTGRYVAWAADETLLFDLERGTERPIAREHWIVSEWLPDGSGVLGTLVQQEGGNIGVLQTQGVDEYDIIIDDPDPAFYPALAPDGKTLLYHAVTTESARDIRRAEVRMEAGAPVQISESAPWLATTADEAGPVWHPSGRWVAYMSNATGDWRVNIVDYPNRTRRIPASSGPSWDPVWSPDGSTLYFRTEEGIVRTDVEDSESMRLSPERVVIRYADADIFQFEALNRSFAVHPISGDIYTLQVRGGFPDPTIVFIENWDEALD